jgi:hypothetical protein
MCSAQCATLAPLPYWNLHAGLTACRPHTYITFNPASLLHLILPSTMRDIAIQ